MPVDYWDIGFLIEGQGARLYATANVVIPLVVLSLVLLAAHAGLCRVARRCVEQFVGPSCAACGYPIKGLASTRCPECGANLTMPNAARTTPFGRLGRRTLSLSWIIVGTSAIVLAWCVAADLLAPRIYVNAQTSWWWFVHPWWFHAAVLPVAAALWFTGWRWTRQSTPAWQGASP